MKKNQVSKKDDPNIPKRNEWPAEELGDFTTSLRVLPTCGLAIVIGAVGAFVALALLRLNRTVANLFYFEPVRPEAVEAYPDEPLRAAVYRMAEKVVTRMPVAERQAGRLLDLISLDDPLAARTRHLKEELRREQLKFTSYFFWREAQRPDCAYRHDERSFPMMPKIG